jgi:hypothetical protein
MYFINKFLYLIETNLQNKYNNCNITECGDNIYILVCNNYVLEITILVKQAYLGGHNLKIKISDRGKNIYTNDLNLHAGQEDDFFLEAISAIESKLLEP